jgi:hypothetical protein
MFLAFCGRRNESAVVTEPFSLVRGSDIPITPSCFNKVPLAINPPPKSVEWNSEGTTGLR